jgi:hypothetical protein
MKPAAKLGFDFQLGARDFFSRLKEGEEPHFKTLQQEHQAVRDARQFLLDALLDAFYCWKTASDREDPWIRPPVAASGQTIQVQSIG